MNGETEYVWEVASYLEGGGGDKEWEAGGFATTPEEAEREGLHYLHVYGQDGGFWSLEVFRVSRKMVARQYYIDGKRLERDVSDPRKGV